VKGNALVIRKAKMLGTIRHKGGGRRGERRILIKYLEKGYELLGTDECEFSETLSNDVPGTLFLALAVLEEQCEDGSEVGLQDGGSCACCSLSHNDLQIKIKNCSSLLPLSPLHLSMYLTQRVEQQVLAFWLCLDFVEHKRQVFLQVSNTDI
jgi:hypothetical protein